MSFSAFAEKLPEVVTLVPARQMDFNSITQEAPNVDCEDQEKQAIPGTIQLDLSRLDLSIRNAVYNRDHEIEVNGERYIQLEEPGGGSGSKPRLNIMENDDGYVALAPTGVKFQLHNIKGSFSGKKLKFSIPLQ